MLHLEMKLVHGIPQEDGDGQFYCALGDLKFSPTPGEGLAKWEV